MRIGEFNMGELTETEKRTLDFIKKVGEIQTNNIPDKHMVGAISKLKNMGLVEVFKKQTSYYRKNKKKFVKIKERLNEVK
jgi:hypothetical protein